MALKEFLNRREPGAGPVEPGEEPAYWVDEEGLNSRTSCREDPIEGDKNGLRQLVPILESHAPLDMVVVMLGTNDLKLRFNPIPADIALGVRRVVQAAQESHTGPGGGAPRVLMICPPPTEDSPVFKHIFGDCVGISKKLAPLYHGLAKECGACFLDAGKVVKTSAADGIHLDPEGHLRLAEAVAEIIREL
jgi:lysophospholipase L1-like esterase